MMQHVATAKSEIAAFATSTGSNSISGVEPKEQFGKLLQDQKSLHSLTGDSKSTPPQASIKKPSQSSTVEVKKDPSSANREDTTAPSKSTTSEPKDIHDAQTSSSSSDNTVLQSGTEENASDKSENDRLVGQSEANDDSVNVSESAANNLNDKPKVGTIVTELNVSSELDEIESNKPIESTNIDAQEWVTLVDKLQKLADIARSTKAPSEDNEDHSLEISSADLQPPNEVEKSLLEQGAEQQIIDIRNGAPDMSGLRQTGFVDDENVDNADLVPIFAKEKNQPDLAIYIQEALDKLIGAAETDYVPTRDSQQKTAELLLEQPAVLQNLVNQKAGTDTTEQKTPATTTDKVIEKAPILVDPQVASDGPVNITLAENQALLKTLLDVPETDKILTQQSDKLPKPILSTVSEQLVQTQQSESLITKLEPVAEQSELLDEDVQIAPNNLPNANKTEKVTNNNDIKTILNLTDNKLDKVLENIAQRVFESKKAGEPMSPEQIAQQVVMPKAADIISSVESSSKDFIAALKSGLEEFKAQLSQGREPGMDLKALVADALANITDSPKGGKAPLNLEQVVSSVSQVLDFAQTMSRAIEHHHDQTYSASIRDATQIQGEQSKQIQLNQFESKFEKAINIAKPEGHQQLAEKVRWMVNTKNLVAEIRLDPAELGSVHVKVAMSGESATVNFVVQSQQARDAVDNATPRLREMLAEKGIELGQSSVRQESDGQQGQSDSELARQGGHANNDAEDLEMPEQVLAQQNIVNGALGGIDYFV